MSLLLADYAVEQTDEIQETLQRLRNSDLYFVTFSSLSSRSNSLKDRVPEDWYTIGQEVHSTFSLAPPASTRMIASADTGQRTTRSKTNI